MTSHACSSSIDNVGQDAASRDSANNAGPEFTNFRRLGKILVSATVEAG